MMPLAFLGIILAGAAFAITNAQKPRVVQLSPPGAVIFNPAPPTASATFLGDITGTPGSYWNITQNSSQIPLDYINPTSGLSFGNSIYTSTMTPK